jgi:hypothetical protein
MFDCGNAINIAERLKQEFGEEALAVVGMRVEEARQASDQDGVRFWKEVARRLVASPERRPRAESPDEGGRRLWWLMQRIEYYRHHALEAERKAAAVGSSRLRHDLTDLAMSWRELALQADLLAREPDRSAPETSEQTRRD